MVRFFQESKQMIDTHCHINDKRFDKDINEVISRSIDSGVEKIICIGTDLKSSEKAITLSNIYDSVYASIGFHPHDSKDADKGYIYALEEMSNDKKVVAIGETGLDYYYKISDKNIQKKIFNEQIELAQHKNLPVIMHCRKSSSDLIDILVHKKLSYGVVHCFSENWNIASKLLKLNIKLSFTGIITFVKDPFQEVVEKIPMDDFFIETDSPYLSPHPNRGKRNEPSYVRYVAKHIARIKGISTEEIIDKTTENALSFFKKINPN